jgi:hypothetical protein
MTEPNTGMTSAEIDVIKVVASEHINANRNDDVAKLIHTGWYLAETAVPRLLSEVDRLSAALAAKTEECEAAVSFMYRMADDPHWCDACKKCPCVDKGKVPLPGYCDFEWDGTDGKVENRICTDNTKGATNEG